MAEGLKPFFIGCDLGTSAAKAVVADGSGTVRGAGRSEYSLRIPGPGRAEQDADEYWRAACESIRQACEEAGVRGEDVGALALSSQAPVCIPVDEDGSALGPALIWMDRRAEAESALLRRRIGDEQAHALSGNIIDPYYQVPKILWIKRHQPEIYRRASCFLGAKDYVLRHLTGRVVTDYAHAALAGVAFNLRAGIWDREVLSAVGIPPEKLPGAYPCDSLVGQVSHEAAVQTGLVQGTPVAAGTVDLPAALLSLNLRLPGDQVLTLGSTACWAVVAPGQSSVRGMITMPCPWDGGRAWMIAGATVAAGAALQWIREWLRCTDENLGPGGGDMLWVDRRMLDSPPGARGLIFLPYLAGERTPIWDSRARGCFIGLTFTHTHADLLRSVVEGIAFNIRHNIDQVPPDVVTPAHPLWVTEGGANSPVWRQILSDILGMPVAWVKDHRGAPLGDAHLAALAVHHPISVTRPQEDTLSNPSGDCQALYRSLYDAFREAYPRLRPVFCRLTNAGQFHVQARG